MAGGRHADHRENAAHEPGGRGKPDHFKRRSHQQATAGRPERTADGDLALSIEVDHDHEIRDVRTRYKQDERDGRKDNQQRDPDRLAEHAPQRLDGHLPSARRGIEVGDAAHDFIEILLGPRNVEALFESAHEPVVILRAVVLRELVRRQQRDDIRHFEKPKPLGQHANDEVRVSELRERLSDGVRITAESTPPEVVTEDDDLVIAVRVRRLKATSKDGTQPGHAKKVRRDFQRSDDARAFAVAQAQLAEVKRRQPGQRPGFALKI